jgi:hypothetical protein
MNNWLPTSREQRFSPEPNALGLGYESAALAQERRDPDDGGWRAGGHTKALDLGAFQVIHESFEMHDLEPLLLKACGSGA